MRAGERRDPSGFAFVAVLVLLALVSLGLAVAGPMWSRQAQREREQELIRVGTLYARAIASYRDVSPGGVKEYPATLEDLTLDRRFVRMLRHLRTVYPDPMAPGRPWGTVRDDKGRIVGVFSDDTRAPIAQVAQEPAHMLNVPASRYSDWVFRGDR